MKYVIIGASAAGISTVKKLRELDKQAEIVMISEDTQSYSRCLLYHYLDDTRTLEEMQIAGFDIETGLNIQWKKGVVVQRVNNQEKFVLLNNQEKINYDKLCIASGAHTFYPPIDGLKLAKNVIGFRNITDAFKIKECIQDIQNILVIGAGLVGIDVICGLLKYQKKITLVDMGKHIMPIQLDETAAYTYQEKLNAKNVTMYFENSVKELILDENKKCRQVILNNNQKIETDFIINCAGVRANIDFLKGTNIECDRYGLCIDEYGRTSDQYVYGAGDVTGRQLVWPVAVKEGIVAAYSMVGQCVEQEDYFSEKSSMYFFDIPTLSIGKINGYDETYREEKTVTQDGNYRKIVWHDNKVVGALFQGDLADSTKYCEMIMSAKKRG